MGSQEVGHDGATEYARTLEPLPSLYEAHLTVQSKINTISKGAANSNNTKTKQFQRVVPVVKNLPANAGDVRDTGSIPRSRSSPGGDYGNPLQYSCLENHIDREAWQATVDRVAKNQTQLK